MTQEMKDNLILSLEALVHAYRDIEKVKSESQFIRLSKEFMQLLKKADEEGQGDNYACWKYIIEYLMNVPLSEYIPEQLPESSVPAMVKINGKVFRCTCGCNVFTKYKEAMYRCNACGTDYIGS